MTTEEAIYHIKFLRSITYNLYLSKEIESALDIAIEALEHSEIIRCGECMFARPYFYNENCVECLLDHSIANKAYYCASARRKEE